MNNGTPFFSIAVPVYNAESYLRECLDSVVNQTFANWECICVDDGSTDGSGAILDEYANADKRFRIVHTQNFRVAEARNTAIGMSRGGWVCFIDSDDSWDSCWLENAYRVIKSFPNVDLVHLKVCDGSSLLNQVKKDRYYLMPDAYRWGLKEFSAFGVLWLCFIRRQLLLGKAFTGLSYKEDSIFLLRLLPSIKNIYDCEFCGYHYRMVSGSLSKRALSEKHCIRYLLSCLRIWKEHSNFANTIGCKEDLRKTIRFIADHDIIEWALRSGGLRVIGNRAIKDAYKKLKNSGALSERYADQNRYKVPFRIWGMTNSILGFVLIREYQKFKDILACKFKQFFRDRVDNLG